MKRGLKSSNGAKSNERNLGTANVTCNKAKAE